MKADVVLLIGANPVVNHPVAATWIKNAVKGGTKLILADPRRSELARHATHYLQFKPDTDVALLNAMMHTIIEEGLVAAAFIADRTSGYDEIRKNVANYSPEAMAPVCGIPAASDPRGRAPVRDVAWFDDPVGHGHFAARPRHRQRALPDRARADDRAGRAPGDRAASAARPEQRPGRERRRPDSDDASRLQPRRQRRRAQAHRSALARDARPEARADRRRDHGRGACGQDSRHVHHGRESSDVRSRCLPCPRGTRRRWRCWSCRTSSLPKPGISPT